MVVRDLLVVVLEHADRPVSREILEVDLQHSLCGADVEIEVGDEYFAVSLELLAELGD